MALISASDYNTLQSQVREILGDGSPAFGIYGYGQSLVSSSVAQNNKITALDWQHLITDVNVAYQHQTNTIVGYNAVQGAVISQTMRTAVGNALSSMLASPNAVHPAQLEAFTTQIIRYDRWGMGTTGITGIFNISFPDTLSARYFFNQGGTYTLQGFYQGDVPVREGYPPPQNEVNWKDALDNHATLTINRSVYNTIVASGSSYVQIFYYDFTGPNYIEILGNTTDGGNSINIKIVLQDNREYAPGFYQTTYGHYHHGITYIYHYGWTAGEPDGVTRPVGFNVIRRSAVNAFTGIRPTTTIVQAFQ